MEKWTESDDLLAISVSDAKLNLSRIIKHLKEEKDILWNQRLLTEALTELDVLHKQLLLTRQELITT